MAFPPPNPLRYDNGRAKNNKEQELEKMNRSFF